MRRLASVVLATVLLTSVPAYPRGMDRLPGSVCVEVVSENGKPLLTVPHRDLWQGGTRIIKQYLEADRGETYGIVISNRTPKRIGVVVAVDGRNIISGRRSELASNEEMYLVNAWDKGRYDGWRTDRETVHRFYFTDPGDSYSERTFHDASAMGVIAVAVYREKDRPAPAVGYRGIAPAAPQADLEDKSLSRAKEEAAGTGFGSAQHSPTIQVAFEPEPAPVQKMLIKYEWLETLCRREIVRCGQETGNRLWDGTDYAPFPPDCRGN
jgi:hypothetical protein